MQYQYIGIALGISAAIVQLVAYAIYNKTVGTPNAASWFMWTIGALVEGMSYIEMTGDWVKNLLPIACCIACITTFVYSLLAGKFEKLGMWDCFVILLDLIALGIWYHWQSAMYANLWMQLTAFLSFLPMFKEVYGHPEEENETCWYLWALAYALLGGAVVFRYEKWEDLVYPANFAILHLAVAILAHRKAKT